MRVESFQDRIALKWMEDEMDVTASRLRQNIYRLLDRVASTGIPLVIRRKAGIVKVVAEKKTGKLARLKKRNIIKGDPRDIIHMDWSKEWHP